MHAGPLKRFGSETVEAREPDLAISTASQRSTGYYLFKRLKFELKLPVQGDLRDCLSTSCAPGLPEERKYNISAQLDDISSGISTNGPASWQARECGRSVLAVCLRAHEIGPTWSSNKAAF